MSNLKKIQTRNSYLVIRDSDSRGFTLLEALVSIFILTLTIVAPMSIASSTLFQATVAKEQVTAFYLAQEAIEGVRSIRDGNVLKGGEWLTGLGAAGGISLGPCIGQDCRIDVVSNPVSVVSCGACTTPINYNSSTHLYQYSSIGSSNQPSNFIRTVRIDSIPSNPSNEVSISVTVSWNIGKISRTFVARENIFNWQ